MDARVPVRRRLKEKAPKPTFVTSSERLQSPLQGFVTSSERLQSPLQGFVSSSERLQSPLQGFVTSSERLQSPLQGAKTEGTSAKKPGEFRGEKRCHRRRSEKCQRSPPDPNDKLDHWRIAQGASRGDSTAQEAAAAAGKKDGGDPVAAASTSAAASRGGAGEGESRYAERGRTGGSSAASRASAN